MVRFARRMDGVESSRIRKMFDQAQKIRDVIDLSLGQPDFPVPAEIISAARAAMEGGHNRYTVTQGIPELREKLGARLKERYGWKGGGVLITSGCSGALLQAMMVLVDPGDEVIIPDPCFLLYPHLIRLCGGTPVPVDTYPDFRLRAEAIESKITPKTKLLLINTPSNPTGVSLRTEELQAIAAMASRHNLLVISDEIYDAYHYEGGHQSLARHLPGALIVGGFSKTYAIPGWRLGFAAGPEEIIEKMTIFQQISFVCASTPAQRAGLTMLDLDMSRHLDPYRRKRDFVYEGIKDLYPCVKPEGAFYLFPQTLVGTDEEFCRRAMEEKLLIVPGRAFSSHTTHFRVCYAAPDEQLKRGVDVLRKIARG